MPRRLAFPGLPPGPHRELLLFLHELHRLAGEPSTRAIANGVTESTGGQVRCSHTTVHKVLGGHQLPTNGDLLFEIAKWLNGRNRHRPQDEEALLDRLEDLWRVAQRYEALAPVEMRTAPRVFISYSHDSPEHRESVVRLATLLRRCGIEAVLDQWEEGVRRDWSKWTTEQIMTADFVLVIASPAYRWAADGSARASSRGAAFESAILRDSLYRDRTRHLNRILPVVLPGRSVDEIPLFLLPHSADYYIISEFSLEGAEELLRTITNQPAVRPPAAGSLSIPSIMTTPPIPERSAGTSRSSSALSERPGIMTKHAHGHTAVAGLPTSRSPVLPEPQTSWAVLAGVSAYETLPELPQAAAGVNELRALLTEAVPHAAFLANHTSVVINPRRSALLDAVARASDDAQDTLLIYFTGHGLVSPRRGDLLLSTVDTRPGSDYTAASYDSIRDLISASRAKS